jgi:hypothetical protein
MTKSESYNTTIGAKAVDQDRDCDRCGRDRPADPRRFTVTATDQTDRTTDFEKVLLCPHCWRDIREDLRRCFA